MVTRLHAEQAPTASGGDLAWDKRTVEEADNTETKNDGTELHKVGSVGGAIR
jgi:hypothetical protein